MPVTKEELKNREQDYFVARLEGGELTMEPHCLCGAVLDETYFCEQCRKQCQCTFVACEDAQTLSMVRKFLHGNPKFRNFEASMLDQ
jgi:hypothetical protein